MNYSSSSSSIFDGKLLLIFQMVDEVTKKTLSNIPLLKTKASPRDGEQWRQRLKEELQALIQVNEETIGEKFIALIDCFSM